jgi:hypothetical protein
MAVEKLTREKVRGMGVVVFSDSMAALMALRQNKIRSSLVANTIYKLNNLARSNSVILQWVRAHVGTEGNEMADTLAKNGTIMVGPSRFHWKQSLKRGNSALQARLRDVWMKKWQATKTCRQTRYWCKEVNEGRTDALVSKGRILASQTVQFITGFNTLMYHENNMGKSDSPNCKGYARRILNKQFIWLLTARLCKGNGKTVLDRSDPLTDGQWEEC